MNDRLRLVLLSFLMLFVELALIRWAGSNIVYLSYFSNFVLLGSFLGIGLGFLRAGRERDLSPWAPVALGLFVLLVAVFPVRITQEDKTLFFFSKLKPKGPPREVVLALVFVAVALVMGLIAEGVARTFKKFPPLVAYRYDLIGSVLGIVGFSVVSFLRSPPLGWGVVVALVFVALALPVRSAATQSGSAQEGPARSRSIATLASAAALAVMLVTLGVESFSAHNSWSPYYKITATPNRGADNQLQIDVNGVPHQLHQSARFAPGAGIYDVAAPQSFDDVLVIGAGGGNDVSVALTKGARHVDAVEIDPRIYDLGKSHHPDHPYQDKRVSAHIDDGRAFLERTRHRYDLIVLALPDSITLVSGQSSLRLESYLFTKQALSTARDRLKPGGVFTMYNYYRQPWLIDRYGNTLQQVYGRAPCQRSLTPDRGFKGEMLVPLQSFEASRDAASLKCGSSTSSRFWRAGSAAVPPPATDDHPFPYLRTRTLPSLYVVTLGLILAASVLLVRGAAGPFRPMLRFADLFFMGVAFLLLETKNVVQFALLFGTTWFVNALVFGGVLLTVLLAVAVSTRVSFRRPQLLYVVLLGTLVVAFVLPPSLLLDLAVVPRFVAAVAIAFAPIFTANLVFTQRFKDTGDSTTAFGANLLGAMFGGVLEYAALIVGYRLLLVGVAIFYGLAFVCGRRYLGSGPVAVATTPQSGSGARSSAAV